MKIYVASSWRNPLYPPLVSMLRAWGHNVYDFRDDGFSWAQIDPNYDGRELDADNIISLLQSARAGAGYLRDKEALDWAEVVILCMPCGNSAHAEFGYAVGAGKRTIVLLPHGEGIRPDLMWKLGDLITVDTDELREALA